MEYTLPQHRCVLRGGSVVNELASSAGGVPVAENQTGRDEGKK